MPDPLDLVNAYVRRMRGWTANAAAKGEPDNWTTNADAMEAVSDELKRLRAWAKPVPASYGDLSDLPPELMAQLSGVKTDVLEDQIYAVAKAAGDEIELDKLLIELFRRHGDVHQRRFLNNKCYRMAQKGLIHILRGRKGVYTIHPQAVAVIEDDDEFGAPVSKVTATDFDDLDDDVESDEEIEF